ncbi:MAG: 2'-5' RNA ligase family protein [Nocardioidaceae bacterium]
MHLFAALLPPAPVREELAGVVRSVAPRTTELDAVPAGSLFLPITAFGNVTRSDARALETAIAREAATWRAPELRFSGAAALEWPGDENVWATLEGDLDALNEIGRGVPTVVQRLGFFVDRRKFRPWLSVGTITDSTTAPYLERLVAALEALHGQTFRFEEISVMRRLPPLDDGSDGGYEVTEHLPLKTS